MQIYSSENNTWIKCRGPCLPQTTRFQFHGYWDNAVIWYSISSKSFFIFDVVQDHLEQIPHPHPFQSHNIFFDYFGDCQGNLNVAYSEDYSLKYVYQLQRKYSKLSLLGYIDLDSIAKHYFKSNSNFEIKNNLIVLSFVRRVPEEDSFLSEHKKLQLEKLTLRREDSSRVVSPNRILMSCNKRKFITQMISSESWSTSEVGLLILRCLSQFFFLPNRMIVRLCGKTE
jgi:hypothetical protein